MFIIKIRSRKKHYEKEDLELNLTTPESTYFCRIILSTFPAGKTSKPWFSLRKGKVNKIERKVKIQWN